VKSIEVKRAPSGAPSVMLHGAAAELAATRGADEFHISLTHTAMTAAASSWRVRKIRVQVEGVIVRRARRSSASAIAHNVRALKSVVGRVSSAPSSRRTATDTARTRGEGGTHWRATCSPSRSSTKGSKLRESGVTAPILLLAEVPADTIAAALENSLTITIRLARGRPRRGLEPSARRTPPRSRESRHRDAPDGVAPNDVDEVVDVLTSSAAIDLEGITRISACDVRALRTVPHSRSDSEF